MTHAPALEARIASANGWRGGVALLATLCAATSLLWWAAHGAPRPTWVGAAALAGCALAAGCAAGWVRAQPAQLLRWDGQGWWLSRGAAPAEAGRLFVALDLGDWLLLRFSPEGRSGWLTSHWISLQRRGLEGMWHVLRCTLHAASSSRETASA